ncbi:MAG TPA: hypothetical protein PLE39_06520 [Anaerolineales bacterium]|nr:hypothetical protein [Anaerolineales bacterium]
MRRLSNILLILLAGLLVVQAGLSLQWPIAHDEAPLLYEAFLMHSEGRVPYRDLFDFQMPGSFAAYYLLGRLSGFNGFFRLRLLDLGILAALLAITFLFMRRFGRQTAFAAAILFGLKYMQGGAFMSLQREYLLLGFVALAVWVSMRDVLTYKHRLLIGILFGLSAVIKPHAALGLLPILLFDITSLIQRQKLTLIKSAMTSTPPVAIGFAMPILAMIGWLAATNALTPFLDIVLHYVPLYAQINGQMEITEAGTRIPFLLNQSLRLGGHALWVIPAALGVYLVPQENKRQAWLLAGLAACYAVYPAFSGQFFEYHYIPFIYFIVILAALALTEQQPLSTFHSPPSFLFPLSSLILLFAIAFAVRPSNTFLRQIQNRPIAKTTDRAEEIASYLKENMQAGDTVQPLDWTGGTLLAMLETRAPLATKYVFDFYFYHHISTPYIQNLRADFMDELQEADPRFIVEVIAVDKPWLTGSDTSREFPELRAFLKANYSVTILEDDYLIYKRK